MKTDIVEQLTNVVKERFPMVSTPFQLGSTAFICSLLEVKGILTKEEYEDLLQAEKDFIKELQELQK